MCSSNISPFGQQQRINDANHKMGFGGHKGYQPTADEIEADKRRRAGMSPLGTATPASETPVGGSPQLNPALPPNPYGGG